MAQQQSPWLEGAYGWSFGEGGWNTGMDSNLLKFSFMFDRNVDSITASLPAAVNGQAHYLTTDNRLYFAVGTTYFSTPVPKWFTVIVRGTGQTHQFNGTTLVQADTPVQLDSRLDAVELTVSNLGTAAFEDIGFFATQAELDVAEGVAAAYTDTLRSDVANASNITKGSDLVGFTNGVVGSVPRTVRDKILEQAITPEDFGAVGDGVIDDTAAFTAINLHLTANSGGYVLLRKTYNIPDGWQIPTSDVAIYGLGQGEIKSSGLVNDAIYGTSKNNIIVDGVKVSIPRTNLRSGKFCIIFTTSNNIRVRNCHTDGGTVGVWTVNCTDVLVTDCYIDTPKADGIHFGHGSKRCRAINNTVVNSGDDAFSTTYYTGFGGRPADITFIGNTVVGTIWGFGVAAYGVDRCVIANNNISGTALGGVTITDHEDSGNAADVLVTGNRISDACNAEVIPESYWNGTAPGLDPDVTSDLQKSAIVVQGTDISVKGNHVSQVSSFPSGLQRRGMTLNGTVRASITDNTFNNVNGDGINTGSLVNDQLIISGNALEEVLGVGIRAVSTVTNSLAICGNTGGYGATLGEPYLVLLQNAGAVLTIIANNNSSGGRGVFADGSSTNVTSTHNIFGAQVWAAFTPTITAGSGTLTTASAQGYYYVDGKTLFFKVRGSITTNGTGADSIIFGALPNTAKGGQNGAISVGRESGLTGQSLTGTINSGGSTIIVRKYDNSYPGGTGAVIEMTGFYEIA